MRPIFRFSKALLLFTLFLSACMSPKWTVPAALTGTWEAEETRITVRTEPKWMRFQFHPGRGGASITIDSSKVVSGRIGMAEFRNGQIVRNGGNPERTGVAYIVRCGGVGRIFPGDPLESKEVELWLGPIHGEMKAELRYTQGGAQFPMGDFRFRREEER